MMGGGTEKAAAYLSDRWSGSGTDSREPRESAIVFSGERVLRRRCAIGDPAYPRAGPRCARSVRTKYCLPHYQKWTPQGEGRLSRCRRATPPRPIARASKGSQSEILFSRSLQRTPGENQCGQSETPVPGGRLQQCHSDARGEKGRREYFRGLSRERRPARDRGCIACCWQRHRLNLQVSAT